MSTVTATDAVVPKKGNKKLIIIIAVALLVVLGGGGAALMLLKGKAAAAADAEYDDDDDDDTGGARSGATAAAPRRDAKSAPSFVPLDTFTVNLADRDAERYAQVGITLEVHDAKLTDQIKVFMPVIRNNILMAIADRTAVELTSREGKRSLAGRVQRETSRALGYQVEEPEDADAAQTERKKPRRGPEPTLPIAAVHFSNFIIQ